jgi:lipopolysaccharide transport system permease protein
MGRPNVISSLADAEAAIAPPPPVLVIRARRPLGLPDLRELWRYRDLLWLFTLRDIKVRYKQAALGAAWAIIQPLVAMVVLNAFFGKLLGVADRMDAGVPYPVFLFAGLLPWTFFAASVTASTNSLVANAGILRKVYFPRLLVPVAAVGAPLVDYAIGFVVLLGMMLYFGVPLGAALLLLPLLVLSTILAVLGVGLALASLTVSYRDFRHVVPFLVQVWFFVTPVIYPPTIVPAGYRPLLLLNPMGGVIEGFRSAVLGQPLDVPAWAVSVVISAALVLAGLIYFQHVEKRFADVV